ncbi:MAG: ABC transporter ATP-binding protein [Hyphomicrobiaceae bacterium]|nr:ABC transporter ATP-binding protein [Hyphomicrobiaceae bacterium]
MSFGGLTALDQVDLRVHAGETVGLIGPNGAGKSTFFNVVTGIYAPSGGQVLFRGDDLGRLKSHQVVRRGIARTFQNNRLFWQLSILDNVLIGMHLRQKATLADVIVRYGRTRRELNACAREAIEILNHFSPDLAAQHSRSVLDLPQGDRRRVEICRALASRPTLLLLDEPSAGMSPDETDKLMEDIAIVRRKFSGITIVVIEHDMGVIDKIADRVVVFNFGRKLTEGTFAEIARDPAVVEAYLGEDDGA